MLIGLVLLSGAGEEEVKMATKSTLFIAPKAKPTQDTTKDFTLRVETFTAREWDHTRELPRHPVRTEVSLKFFIYLNITYIDIHFSTQLTIF